MWRPSLAFLLVLGWPVSPAAWAQTEASECDRRIDGDVVDRETHEGVVGALIYVEGEPVAVTEDNGHFVAEGVCPGRLRVEAERFGYHRGGVSLSRDATSIEIVLIASVEEGMTVVVQDEAPTPTMQSAAELAGEALERKRGHDLADALGEVPGVTQLENGQSAGKPIVRGQFGRRLPLLVGNIRHRSQDWGIDHAPEVDPFSADAIRVVRGAAGVRYGPDAIGGAVVIVPPKLPTRPGVNGEVHAIGMWNGRGGVLAGRVQDAPASLPGFAYRLEASGKWLSAMRTPDYVLGNTGTEEWNVGSTVGYTIGSTRFTLGYNRYSARLGVCFCLRNETPTDFRDQLANERPPDADLFSDGFSIERPYQRVIHDLASLRSETSLGLGKLFLGYAFQWDHRREYDTVRSATGPQFRFRLWTHDLDARFEHNPVHISDHLHLRGSVGMTGMVQVHRFSGLQLVPDHDGQSFGVHGSERLLGERFELEAGARYDFLARSAALEERDFLRLVRSDQIAMDACDLSGDSFSCGSSFHMLSATLGGLVQITEPWAVKLHLGTASRAPNPDEQYLNGTSPSSPVLGLGQPDLGTETTYSATLTTTWQSERVAAEASAYINHIDDYIYFAPALNAIGEPIIDVLSRGAFPRFTSRPVNANFYGADGGIKARPRPWLELAGQVSLIRADNTTGDAPLAFVPPNRARGAVTVKRKSLLGFKNLYAELSSTLVARQNRFDINADLAPPPDGYMLVGAEVGAEREALGQQVRVALVGRNLANKRYREYTSLMRYFADQPGMQLLLRLSVLFDARE